MKGMGELPLWRGLTDAKYVRQIRFVFLPGAMFINPSKNYFRVIRFNETRDGTGIIESVKYVRVDREGRHHAVNLVRLPVSKDDTLKLNTLANDSGTWNFEIGTWDNNDDIYVHCPRLEMERGDADGYRFSSVNIGCNQPAKLMPLVEHLTTLARVRPNKDGRY